MKIFTKWLLLLAVPVVLIGCSGTPGQTNSGSNSSSGSGSNSTPGSYTIGGTVTGLTGSGLVLQDDGGDNLSVTASGSFTFKTSIASGKTYSVSVGTQPTNPTQSCTVTNASGTASANVTNVAVTCGTNSASITVAVSGLTGSGLVLLNNGGDNLSIPGNGAYTFKTPLSLGSTYNVTVGVQPTTPSQSCTVSNPSGTANQNVGNIVVNCSIGTISIGGSVSGLAGTGLVLVNNGNTATIATNGSFTFSTLVSSGTAYNVTVQAQPTGPAQTCTVSNGTGTATANVTTVTVVCPAVFFPVGGQVVGLVGNGGGAVIQNNGGDNLTLTGNGAFTFPTQIALNGPFDAFLLIPPSSQSQPCVIWDYQGVVTGPITSILVDCGHNDWNWMNGANTANQTGNATTPPTPPVTSLDTATPGGRKGAETWVDNSHNLWLFGGIGWDLPPATPQPIFMNDMWEYVGAGSNYYYGGFNSYWQQVQTNNWSSATQPVPRWGAVTWTDAGGTLWMFGGQWGQLSAGGIGFMNDIWSFNTSSKTWTQASYSNPACNTSSGLNLNGVYGTKGVPSANNCPGSRWGATGRLDSSGNLWLFGGFGYDGSSSTPGLLNDLWEFTGGQWVWVSGSNTINQDGVYGSEGTPSALNMPGGRQSSMSWIDSSGNFWLFGGYNLSPLGQPDGFNDLWKFSGGQWTWVSGSQNVNAVGNYGLQGIAAASNVPGARWNSGAWIDDANRLYLFGGDGFDATANGTLGDLWEFTISSGNWTWVKGPSSVNQPGTYGLPPGQVDYPHVVNFPGTRWAPAFWKDPTDPYGFFWMFGGEGYDSSTSSGGTGLMNDLWRYLPFP